MTRTERTPRRSGWIRSLVEPVLILFDNRSLTWLVLAFAGVTVAEWGYVTALAVDAFRLHGSIAVGLVGFRLFFASIGSFLSIPYIERHPSGRLLTGIAALGLRSWPRAPPWPPVEPR